MEDYQWGGGEGEQGEKLQGIRSIIGSHKIDRGRLRIVQEMEKPNNIYTTNGHKLSGGGGGLVLKGGRCREEGDKGDNKIGTTVVKKERKDKKEEDPININRNERRNQN